MTPEERTSDTRPTDPPTRFQGPGRASSDRRSGPEPVATRIQNAPRRQPGATRIQNAPRRSGTNGTAGPDPAQIVPAVLRERFVVGEQLGSGGEATVWLAHPAGEPDTPVALKVYRHGAAFDLELRHRLDRPDWRRYVPELRSYGVARLAESIEVGWEAMEYFPLGTLADLVARETPPGGRLPDDRLRAIVAELVDSFEFWENTVRSRQTDVSPGNVLVRSDGPHPEFVTGDFGGVVGTGTSKRFGDLMAKAPYMSPESLAGLNDPLGPYWSLGAICYELLSGRRVFGDDLTEDTIRVALIFDEPGVGDLPELWRDPVAGLLTRRLEDRWGAREVRDWLAGRKVPVRRGANGAAHLPVTFASTPYNDPIALTAAMVDNSDEAADWLCSSGAARLSQWLGEDLKDHRFDRRLLADIHGDTVAAHVVVAALAATYLPNLPPRYRGVTVTAERLRVLAGDPARHQTLVDVIRRGMLPYAARHHCDHLDCATTAGDGGCGRLTRLAQLLPRAVAIAMNSLAALPGEFGDQDAQRAASIDPAAGRVLTPVVERDVCATATMLATQPEPSKGRPVNLRFTRGPDEPWWQLRRRAALTAEPDSAEGLAALVVAETLRPFARAYRQALSKARRVAADPGGTRWWSGTGWRDRAGRLADRLDNRVGQHTWPWMLVVVFAAVEAFGLSPTVRSWAASDPQVDESIRQGATWLRSNTPDFVTGATDPLGAWQSALSPDTTRWLGPALVAAIVVACLALARKTTGRTSGARLTRVLAALTGRLVMAASLLHLAVLSFGPVANGLTATSPWLVGLFVVVVAGLIRPLSGTPRSTAPSAAPWPARLLVGGGLIVAALMLLQSVPLPDPGPPVAPARPAAPTRHPTPRSTK